MVAVVCDSSPLVYLSRLELFQLLGSLYGTVLIPPAVWEEVAVRGQGLPESNNLRGAVADGWIRVERPKGALGQLEQMTPRLGQGELQAILLAKEQNAILVTDDALGRLVAENLGLEVTGTVGVLIRAKRHGQVPTLRPILDTLRTKTNFRISGSLYRDALRAAGEPVGDSEE